MAVVEAQEADFCHGIGLDWIGLWSFLAAQAKQKTTSPLQKFSPLLNPKP
jgi:hypothetical protein